MIETKNRTRRNFLQTLGSASLGLSIAGRSFGKTQVQPAALVTEFGACTSIENFALLKGQGYQYVEDQVGRLLNPTAPDSAVREVFDRIKKEGIQVRVCNYFVPGNLRSVGKDANHEGVLKYVDIAFRRAKELGVKGIVFGSSGSRRIKDGFDPKKAEAQFVELLKKMAPLAQAQGVEVWVEPLNRKEVNFINTQIEGAAIVEKVGHPSVGMVCDIYHMARNEEPAESIAQVIKHIRHCHIAEKEKRTAPGVNNYDFSPYLNALKTSGYSGRMSMECQWADINTQAKGAREYVEKQISAL